MEKTKILTLGEAVGKRKGTLPYRAWIKTAMLFLGGAIFSCGQVLGGMAPFGAAYFAVFFRGGITYAMIPLFTVVGLLSGVGFFSVAQYTLAMLFFALISIHVSERKELSSLLLGGLIALSNLLAGVLVMMGGIPLLYDVLRLLLESLFVAVSALSIAITRDTLSGFKTRQTLTPEEVVSLGAFLGIFLLGLGTDTALGTFRFSGAIGAFLVMLFAYKYGAAAAAAAGCAIGFFVGMSSFMTAESVSAFTFSGLAAGLFSRYKKWGVSLGFIFSNALFAIILSGSRETVISIYEIMIAATCLGVLPERLLSSWGGFSVSEREHTHDVRVREVASRRLQSLSESFGRLEHAFLELKEHSDSRPVEETVLFERVANEVCADCSLRKCCWNIDVRESYRAMEELLETVRTKGEVTRESLPVKFRDNCVRQVLLTETFGKMYEIYKIDRLWSSRVEESRQIIVSQIGQVAQVTESIAEEIREGTAYDQKLEATLLRTLKKAGVKVRAVRVSQNREEMLEAVVSLAPCGGFGKCKNEVLPLVEQALEKPMERLSGSLCGGCEVHFVQARELSVTPAAAFRKASGSRESGDSYRFMNLPGGIFAATLSDGMGTGKRAARESRVASELIHLLLEAGFRKEGAVGMVNSVLITRGVDTRLSAIDLLSVHLSTGRVEFTKAGAPASFILRKGGLAEVFECSSLPAGASGRADVEILKSTVSNGDRIILLSDGVTEGKSAVWVCEQLEDFPGGDETELAEYLLEKAGKENRDDMTCLVLGVKKRAEEETLRQAK